MGRYWRSQIQRACAECGRPSVLDSRAKFCSGACRQAAYRRKLQRDVRPANIGYVSSSTEAWQAATTAGVSRDCDDSVSYSPISPGAPEPLTGRSRDPSQESSAEPMNSRSSVSESPVDPWEEPQPAPNVELDRFYRDVLHELDQHIQHSKSTAQGFGVQLKRLGLDYGIESAERLPLPRLTRARREGHRDS